MKKKILQICDTKGWAIDRLAFAVVQHNPQFDWWRIFLHPRGLEKGEIDLAPVREAIQWADLIDVNYWRSLSQLAELIPEIKEKKILLTHHNEKNILSADWSYVDAHFAKTRYSERVLRDAGYKNIYYVPNSFNPDVFSFRQQWSTEKPVVGYVGRIVAWKGLKEVAKACRELGIPLMIMGKPDDNDYWESIPLEDRENMDFSFVDCSDEDRPEFYNSITCYVGNSRDGRETGPLGLLEAMASGVPCISTAAGIARDIGKDGENMLIVPFDDADAIRDAIHEVLNNSDLGESLRQSGWNTVKNLSDKTMAITYTKAFYDLLSEDSESPLVSVIIPATVDRVENVNRILNRLNNQLYKNVEAIIVWDEKDGKPDMEFESVNFPILHLATFSDGYNLAMARNIGIIHAGGKVLVFCDSRMLPAEDAISRFVEAIQHYRDDEKVWIFGEKGGRKATFVENWSCILRQNIINAGMFNERITEYGGMSQELRSRFIAQGFELLYAPDIQAEQLCKSSMTTEKRRSIIRMKELLNRLNFDK